MKTRTNGSRRGTSPAIIVAALALVAALAGTAIAGPDAVTSALSKKKVKKISKKEINKAAPNLSVDNAENLGGEPASAYLGADAVRHAAVLRNGNVVASESNGITQANVNRESAGFYCVDGLDPAPTGVVATLSANTDAGARLYASIKTGGGVCAGKQIIIQAQNNALTNTDEPFTVLAL